MAKDTYRSPMKSANHSTSKSNAAEAPVSHPVNQDVHRAESTRTTDESVDIILGALADAIAQRVKVKTTDNSGSKPADNAKTESKPADRPKSDSKPADKPKSDQKPKSDGKPVDKPKDKPKDKPDSANKPKNEAKSEPKPTEKKPEVAPVVNDPFLLVRRDGPGKAYLYWDFEKRTWSHTTDPWAADQAGNGEWKAIWVWYKNGEIHHVLDNEELRKYCP